MFGRIASLDADIARHRRADRGASGPFHGASGPFQWKTILDPRVLIAEDLGAAPTPLVEVSVSFRDAWSMLKCAGWLPQDRVFGWERSAGLRTSVARGTSGGPRVAHSLGARCSSRCWPG